MTLRAAFGSALPVLLGACWQVTRPSLPLDALHVDGLPSAVLPASGAVSTSVEDAPEAEAFPAPASMAVGPAVRITEVVGAAPAAVGVMLAPAVAALERCESPSSGKLILRLAARPGSTHFRLVDAAGGDPATRRCALSAVGTIEVDEAVQQSWSRIDAVHGIETQIVLSW